MRGAVSVLLMLAAGCGGEGGDAAASAEDIRRVSTPSNEAELAKAASAALRPLEAADLARLAGNGGLCQFLRNGQLLVAASGTDAVARVGGALRHFVQTAPVDETGIFLEDRQVSISIGRTDAGGEAARLTVTNRRTEVQERWAGAWRCAA